jgi:hypothetical protein
MDQGARRLPVASLLKKTIENPADLVPSLRGC